MQRDKPQSSEHSACAVLCVMGVVLCMYVYCVCLLCMFIVMFIVYCVCVLCMCIVELGFAPALSEWGLVSLNGQPFPPPPPIPQQALYTSPSKHRADQAILVSSLPAMKSSLATVRRDSCHNESWYMQPCPPC